MATRYRHVGAQTASISTKAGTVAPTQGYHSGAGSIAIHADEQAKIITENIKSGITLLGVAGDANVVDTSSGDAIAGDILATKKAWVDGAELTGTMTNRGEVDTDISDKATEVTIAAGYHNGSGVVKIHADEQAKIISENIKDGVTLLGVAGSLTAGTDTSDATMAVGDLLSGKTGYGSAGTKLTGTMTNVGAQTASISTKAGTVTPTQGYHSGAGSISISSTEQDKIIAGNIKDGVTILGVEGELAGGTDTSDATAIASSLLYGHTAYGSAGTKLTGTGALLNNATGINFNEGGLTGAVDLYIPLCYLQSAMFYNNPNMTSLKLTYAGMFASQSYLFMSCSSLGTIDSTLNFTGVTNTSYLFYGCSSLADVVITPSSIQVSMSFSDSSLLTTASLLSIANGLDGSATSQTITMHSTSKTTMDALMVDNSSGTAVAGSAMTLTAFITNIKGWTVA